MIAVDTNIIIRLIVADDEAQVARALALASREPLFVSFTVLIETEWVLRSRYGYDRRRTLDGLNGLEQLIDLRYEEEDDVRWALERFSLAGELADYLHIASARRIGRFASFEEKLPRRAGEQAPAIVVIP